ncbi:MAG: hypothetical protein DRN05_06500 [Thermoplasmata archaeon]|nr:MAG: hypothetical protein DRN05_06500 [Thermoplasmata archaeon]
MGSLKKVAHPAEIDSAKEDMPRGKKSVENVLPWLYLKGISTGDFNEGHHVGHGIQAGSECAKEMAEDTWIQETAGGSTGG